MNDEEAKSFRTSDAGFAKDYLEGDIVLKRVHSWNEFRQQIIKLNDFYTFLNSKTGLDQEAYEPIFRGHANAKWRLESTLERESPKNFSITGYYLLLLKIHEQLKSCGLKNVPYFLKDHAELEKIKDAQFLPHAEFLTFVRHFGFPSPLVDWSCSPYIASFFAFNCAEENEDVSIYSLFQKQLQSLPSNPAAPSQSMSIDFIGEYLASHKRHFLQQSNYTVCLTKEYPGKIQDFCSHKECISAFSDEIFPQAIIFKFILPGSEKKVALKELDKMNINKYSLFGDEESLLNTLFNREALFKN
ncbi:MAG: FRG domain-containing protein [Elusimicrobia bacterium]|nr:FRG domain-containing protein [Elusimicrobiota bacterium]